MPPSAPALKLRTPDVRYTRTMPSATKAVSEPVAAPSSTKRNADWLHNAVASVITSRVPLPPGVAPPRGEHIVAITRAPAHAAASQPTRMRAAALVNVVDAPPWA